ncbi:hypothetical protein [Staphylococcus aureus]|uniref:hypothetical protein n=1 Tax=Staphylococcus aureus TaxID=1280 RepID=UPI0012A244B5|nr:hypothetical protein [Staphylococcus aureus]AYD82575.1 hypothetical protein ART_00106 [Achromobacter phage vB_Ade_ART]MBD4207879.1 hypothetical protein [Xanthomonas citri pv. citri]
MSKPWETKPPTKQWPTDVEAKAAMAPAPKNIPEEGIAPAKLETSPLEGDVISLMGTLTQNQCENIVVIGMSDDGRVISLRRMGPNGSNPYTIIGALEAFKQMIITNELHQEPAKVEQPQPSASQESN